MKYHIRYVEVFWGSKETILIQNHIFDHFRPNGRPYFEISKIHKIAQNSIFAKNSKSCRVADIGRNGNIWPEMDS